MACDCITKVDGKLKPLGVALDLAFTLNKETLSLSGAKVQITTRRIDGKRKKPMSITAAFCPFCGESTEREEE